MAPKDPSLVTLKRDVPDPRIDENIGLYRAIRNSSDGLSYNRYTQYLTTLLCDSSAGPALVTQMVCMGGTQAYETLVDLTRKFVVLQSALQESCKESWCDPVIEKGEGASRKRAKSKGLARFHIDDLTESDEANAEEISRRYTPWTISVSELDELQKRFFQQDKPATPGDASDAPIGDTKGNWIAPFMRRLRQNLRGVPLKPGLPDDCSGVLECKLKCPPLVELIWSYWMEQGMLVQASNAVSMRFQNRRWGPVDPLSRFELTPLRPLNNLLWGYIEAERDRLTVTRRAYEYDHHYGLRIHGRAVPELTPADSRPRFLETFHRLLIEAARYYRLASNTTVNPDGFPLLNSLRDLHIVLAEGMHNQYGDLPVTAREEMLIQQWLLARPEMRDFIGGRQSVPYPEDWMGHMDTVRQAFGWNDASIRHYRDLAVYGEEILLSVRFGDWSAINDANYALSWATFWKPEIQGYIHSYREVTGVDLDTEDVRITRSHIVSTQPTEMILRRRAALPTRVPAA